MEWRTVDRRPQIVKKWTPGRHNADQIGLPRGVTSASIPHSAIKLSAKLAFALPIEQHSSEFVH
jgi:hypothetical protein